MNLKRKIREELNKTGEPKTGYEVHGFTKDNERLKEIEEAGCRYCTFVYNPDGSIIADENGEELLDCWFDDCNASVVPGTWCEDCPKGVKDTKDMKGGSTRRGKVKSNYTKANVSIKEYTRNRTNIDSFLKDGMKDTGMKAYWCGEPGSNFGTMCDGTCITKTSGGEVTSYECDDPKESGGGKINMNNLEKKMKNESMGEPKEYTRNRTNIERFLNEDKEDKPKGKRKGSTPRPSDKAMMNMTKKVLGGVTPSTGMNNWWCCLVACNNPGCKGDRWEVVMNPWG